MTALKGRDIPQFLNAPDEGIVCALIYGPEQGLVHERSGQLAKSVAEDLTDPWRVTNLSDHEASDAGRLTDEAAAQSFLGGRRVIRMRASGPSSSNAVAALLEAVEAGRLQPAALVVVEAGDLKKSAALRKVCERSPRAAAIACYAEGLMETKVAIRHQCSEDGLSIDDDAAESLAHALGDDRGLLRQEVDKLILYKGLPSEGDADAAPITLDDVRACLADAPGEDSFAIAALALSGRRQALSAAMADAQSTGVNVVTLLRLTQARVLRLMPGAQAMAEGQGVGAAMKRIKPPVFFKEQDAFAAQLRAWPLARLERAVGALYQAEQACKVTGAPSQAIAERALLRLAVEASR